MKFLNSEANLQELDELDVWLGSKENEQIFNHFVRTEYITALGMAEYDIEKAKQAIKRKLENRKRKKRITVYKRIAVAASISLLLGLGFLNFYKEDRPGEIPNMAPTVIKAGSNKAILTLDNGNQVALEKGKKYKAGKVKSNGEELVYDLAGDTYGSERAVKYNYLTIPKGGQFFVQLSDSTEVWLNSDSKLKYPVKFRKGKTRQVELVYGEAYFKVSPSTKHNGAEFHVLTKYQEVSVLGTEFNVKAYNGEDEVSTTLVEGKVKIQKGTISEFLRPNQQSKTSSTSDFIEIKEVDLSQVISWKQGLFAFNEESLGEIMTQLARWYDVNVFFKSEQQKKFVFTGIVERTESIDKILNLIEATSAGHIKFEIKGKTIIIK